MLSAGDRDSGVENGERKKMEEPVSKLISWAEESKRAGVGCGMAREGGQTFPGGV